MSICKVGETKTIKGVKYTKKNAHALCEGCAFKPEGGLCTNPGADVIEAIEDGGTECTDTIWVKATKRPSAKEPKMPEPKETKSPLYTAVRDILEAKDRETLDARADAKVSAVLGVLEGPTGFSVGPRGTLSEAIAHEAAPATVVPAAPWSLDGLVIDPGEDAVGQWGFFFGDRNWRIGRMIQIDRKPKTYLCASAEGGGSWSHFATLPGFDFEKLHALTLGKHSR